MLSKNSITLIIFLVEMYINFVLILFLVIMYINNNNNNNKGLTNCVLSLMYYTTSDIL
jgi:hypothetical protein